MQLGQLWRSMMALLTVICLGIGLSACGDGQDSVTDDDAPTEEQTENEPGDDEQVEATEEPPEDPTDVDDPSEFAFGQEVTIVDGAVEPKLLAADVASPVTIRNSTGSVVEVRFTNPGWDEAVTTTTGPLEPGATFEIEPIGVASITYEVVGSDGVTGIIQMEDGLDTL